MFPSPLITLVPAFWTVSSWSTSFWKPDVHKWIDPTGYFRLKDRREQCQSWEIITTNNLLSLTVAVL